MQPGETARGQRIHERCQMHFCTSGPLSSIWVVSLLLHANYTLERAQGRVIRRWWTNAKGWLTQYGLLVNQALTGTARNGCDLAKRFLATLPASHVSRKLGSLVLL